MMKKKILKAQNGISLETIPMRNIMLEYIKKGASFDDFIAAQKTDFPPQQIESMKKTWDAISQDNFSKYAASNQKRSDNLNEENGYLPQVTLKEVVVKGKKPYTDWQLAQAKKFGVDENGNLSARGQQYLAEQIYRNRTGHSLFMRDMNTIAKGLNTVVAATSGAGALGVLGVGGYYALPYIAPYIPEIAASMMAGEMVNRDAQQNGYESQGDRAAQWYIRNIEQSNRQPTETEKFVGDLIGNPGYYIGEGARLLGKGVELVKPIGKKVVSETKSIFDEGNAQISHDIKRGVDYVVDRYGRFLNPEAQVVEVATPDGRKFKVIGTVDQPGMMMFENKPATRDSWIRGRSAAKRDAKALIDKPEDVKKIYTAEKNPRRIIINERVPDRATVKNGQVIENPNVVEIHEGRILPEFDYNGYHFKQNPADGTYSVTRDGVPIYFSENGVVTRNPEGNYVLKLNDGTGELVLSESELGGYGVYKSQLSQYMPKHIIPQSKFPRELSGYEVDGVRYAPDEVTVTKGSFREDVPYNEFRNATNKKYYEFVDEQGNPIKIEGQYQTNEPKLDYDGNPIRNADGSLVTEVVTHRGTPVLPDAIRLSNENNFRYFDVVDPATGLQINNAYSKYIQPNWKGKIHDYWRPALKYVGIPAATAYGIWNGIPEALSTPFGIMWGGLKSKLNNDEKTPDTSKTNNIDSVINNTPSYDDIKKDVNIQNDFNEDIINIHKDSTGY